MKKLIASLFVSIVALCGFTIAATTIPVTNLSGPTSCNSNETVEYKFYLTSNGLSRKPYDIFGNTVDSLVGGGNNGSSINIWKHGVISSCNTWNRISNVVSAGDSNGALIFLNADNCVFNIPNYTKVSNPTAIDAQIHYTIGYRLIYNGGANTMTSRLYHRDYGNDNWTCYPAGNSVSNSDNCSEVTVKYGSQKYHTGECLNYRVFRCGDGLVNSPYGTTYDNGSHVEQCDPNDPTHAGRGNGGCSDSCQPINVQNPQCSSSYNNQTQYTPNGDNWLNQNMNLCTIGSVTNFQFSWNPGHSRHFTWNCTAGGNSTDCLAYQQWCGDGKVESNYGEACDPNDPTHAGWNGNGYTCNNQCQLVPPQIQAPQCSSIYNNQTQYTPNSNPWLNNTMNLCTIGSVTNFQFSWNPGHSRHFTWNCNNDGQSTGCLAYQQWCGDGKVESNHGEACDPADPTQAGRGNGGCSDSCQPINVQNPQCNSQYNGQTQYTPNSNPWLNNTMNLCTIGTLSNFNYSGTPRLFTWNCSAGGNTVNCSANQQRCGDGQLNGSEQCDYNDPTQAGWNGMQCNNSCQLYNPGYPNLTIEKEQTSTGSLTPGSLVAYKITVRNIGSGVATGVSIYDVLPRELQYMTSSISIIPNSTYQFTTGTVQIGGYPRTYLRYFNITLNANGTATVYLTGKVKNGFTFDTLTNCATVSGSNISPHEDCVTTTPPTPPVYPNLTIEKEQTSTGSLTPGSLVAYKITVRNIGSGVATGVSIYDVLPRELQYMTSSISIIPNSTYQFTTGTVQIGGYPRTYLRYFNITLNANGTATVYLTGKVKNGFTFDTLTNCATVSGSNIAPHEDCVTTTPPTAPHLTINKELITAGDMTAGSTVVYKITLTNDGNATYHNAYILDILPNAIQYQTSSIQNITNYLFEEGTTGNNDYFIRYYNFNLTAGHSAIVYLTGVLKQGFNFNQTVNCAFTSGAYDCEEFPLTPVPFVQKYQKIGNDNNPNSDGWTTHTLNVELRQYISYRIDFGNSGNKAATGEVKDILPQCVQYISANLVGANGVGPTYYPNTHTVRFKNISLAAGQRAHMMVVGKIKQEDGCQNIYSYLNTGSFHFIGKTWENSTVLAERPNLTDVEITKTVDKNKVKPGDTVIYTITYKNNGPEILQSYTIVDYWPNDQLVFNRVLEPTTPTPTREGENIVKWHFDTPLGVNETRIIRIEGTVR